MMNYVYLTIAAGAGTVLLSGLMYGWYWVRKTRCVNVMNHFAVRYQEDIGQFRQTADKLAARGMALKEKYRGLNMICTNCSADISAERAAVQMWLKYGSLLDMYEYTCDWSDFAADCDSFRAEIRKFMRTLNHTCAEAGLDQSCVKQLRKAVIGQVKQASAGQYAACVEVRFQDEKVKPVAVRLNVELAQRVLGQK